MKGGELIDAALIATAKNLYFQFVKLKAIAKETGIGILELRRLAYGTGEKDESAWFNERRAAMSDDYVEIGERNRRAAHEYASHAFDLMMRSMRNLNNVGEKKSLSPTDMDRLSSSLLKIDRLLRLTQGLPTDIVGYRDTEGLTSIEPGHEVVDVESVALALSRDISMQRHLQKLKEQNGEGLQHDQRTSEIEFERTKFVSRDSGKIKHSDAIESQRTGDGLASSGDDSSGKTRKRNKNNSRANKSGKRKNISGDHAGKRKRVKSSNIGTNEKHSVQSGMDAETSASLHDDDESSTNESRRDVSADGDFGTIPEAGRSDGYSDEYDY